MKKQLISLYLEWVNNFTTIEKMADYYGFEKSEMEQLIRIGKKYNEEAAEIKELTD